MALLWIDGFDELPDSGASAYLPTAGYLGASGIGVTTGRGETGKCLTLSSIGSLTKAMVPVEAGDVRIFGFGYRYTGGLGAATILTLNTASGEEIVLSRNGSNGLQVVVDGVNTVTTANEVIQGNVWAYIELRLAWDSDDGADHVIIRVNNVTVLEASAPAITDTAPDRYVLRNNVSDNLHLFDDFYLADVMGGVNVDFLGSIYVENAYIESNADPIEFTPLGSISNYLNINDTGVANESRFNASDEIGARDMFNPRDLVVSGDQVFGVQIGLRVQKVGSGTLEISSVAAIGASEVVSAPATPDASYQTFYSLLNTDPTGAVWTVEAFNEMQVGYELTY